MAITNHERIGKALELLKKGLVPFVERELKQQYAQLWFEKAKEAVSELQADLLAKRGKPHWDTEGPKLTLYRANSKQTIFHLTTGYRMVRKRDDFGGIGDG